MPAPLTITVWQCPPLPAAAYDAWLNPDEQARARRFRNPLDSDRFTTARALVRAALGRRTGTLPAGVDVRTHPRHSTSPGRPFVAGGPSFSISHAGALVLVAVLEGTGDTRVGVDGGVDGGVEVGVDVESLAAVTGNLHDLAGAVSPREEPATGWTPLTFTRTWVRREAVLKAVGTGLLAPRDDLVLSPGDRPAAVLHSAGALPPPSRLHLIDLGQSGGHLAALALCSPAPVATPEVVLADGRALLAEHRTLGP